MASTLLHSCLTGTSRRTASAGCLWVPGPTISTRAAHPGDHFRTSREEAFYSATEPWVHGKNDGLLVCTGSHDEARLKEDLLLHALLKVADTCYTSRTDIGDDGLTTQLPADGVAPLRDAYSNCYSPAEAVFDLCAPFIDDMIQRDGGDQEAVERCMRVNGAGTEYGVRDAEEETGRLVELRVWARTRS